METKTMSRIVLMIGAFLFASAASAQETSYLCRFTSGPRAGQIQDYTGHPSGPLPVGSPCQDGIASWGVIVSGRSSGGGGHGGGGGSPAPEGGSCVRPSSEDDCDACRSDRSYERCLQKAGGDAE